MHINKERYGTQGKGNKNGGKKRQREREGRRCEGERMSLFIITCEELLLL